VLKDTHVNFVRAPNLLDLLPHVVDDECLLLIVLRLPVDPHPQHTAHAAKFRGILQVHQLDKTVLHVLQVLFILLRQRVDLFDLAKGAGEIPL